MVAPESDAGREPPAIGTIAGRYEIVRELGRGGAAVVYLARDLRYARPVAVKILKHEIADSVAKLRFLNEIDVTASLQHPHILAILDSGEAAGIPALEGLPFHVTPYLEGESLRARLDRERQLPIADAVRIALEIADALDHAHAHGIIHRDIKPENILFSGRHACVADFGIAHALDCSATDRLTSTGLTVGSPFYMSPEQAAGERELDARSDVYSLACVLYEMLAGVAPFNGATPATVIAQRFTNPARPLRAYRASVPTHIEAAVAHGMALTPADRPHSAAAFAAILEAGTGEHRADASRAPEASAAAAAVRPPAMVQGGPWFSALSRRVWQGIAAATTAAVLLGLYLAPDGVREALGFAGGDLDSDQYVLLPVSGTPGAALTAEVARDRVHEALGRWRDLDLVPMGAVDAHTPTAESLDASLAGVRRLGAGRAVGVQLSPVGDSVQLRATLYDARGAVLAEHALRLPDAAGAHDHYRQLSTALLRVAPPPPDADEGDQGTNLLEAWHAYARGHVARRQWDLAIAESTFRAAVTVDPQFGQAQLWLAQVAAWQRPERADDWRDAASRADRIPQPDSLLARALHALATERYPEACDAYRRLQGATPRSDIPWYGLAHCHAMDPVVVRDAGSPSGWAFRGSYHAAAQALDSAITRADGAPGFAFHLLQRVLPIEPVRYRSGRSSADASQLFGGYPAVQHDTLAFIPYPLREFAAAAPHTTAPTQARALRMNAELLGGYLATWAERAPDDARALEGLALVQELRGERDAGAGGGLVALATVQKARRLSVDVRQQVHLGASEVRLLIKDERFGDARALADSILTAVPRPDHRDAPQLAGLASLIGDLDRTIQLLKIHVADMPVRWLAGDARFPPPIVDVAAELMARAALGDCGQGFATAEARFHDLVRRHVEDDARDQVRRAVLTRPLGLAVPCLGASVVPRIPDMSAPLTRMQRAWADGDHARVRALFDELQSTRYADRPGDVALDHTYQEAWILANVGDTSAAARHLELPLGALTTLSSHLLSDVPQAAALARGMALRAELAAAGGDNRGARQWATAVTELWADASLPLQPLVRRMQVLSR